MQHRLDPGSKALAAQEFRHSVQDEKDTVADYIQKLEQIFVVLTERSGYHMKHALPNYKRA